MAEYSTASPASTGGTSYLTADHLGTPRVITNADGGVQARHDYLPFGEEISINVGGRSTGQGYLYGSGLADNTRHKFTGQQRDDETGLDYFGARYYSSAQGRFTSVDPLMASGRPAIPQSWNRYAYVLNNPLRLVDPDGMMDNDPNDPDIDPEDVVVVNNKQEAVPCYCDYNGNPIGVVNMAGQALSATVTGFGKQAANSFFALPNLTNAIVDTVISPFTDFRFGQIGTYKADSTLEQNAMYATMAVGIVAGGVGGAGGAAGGASGAAAGGGTAGGLARVGRWMSEAEFTAMGRTGMVQESVNLGVTNVAYPANATAFINQAQVGSLYVEFSVPASSVISKGGGWGLIPGPNSIYGRLAIQQGRPVPQMPPAINIVHCATKICN